MRHYESGQDLLLKGDKCSMEWPFDCLEERKSHDVQKCCGSCQSHDHGCRSEGIVDQEKTREEIKGDGWTPRQVERERNAARSSQHYRGVGTWMNEESEGVVDVHCLLKFCASSKVCFSGLQRALKARSRECAPGRSVQRPQFKHISSATLCC